MMSEVLSDTTAIRHRSYRWQWITTGLIGGFFVFFLLNFQIAQVRGSSMEPTYHNGQMVLVARSPWLERPLKSGDVVLVKHDGEILIKRIYRIAGQPVSPERVFGFNLRRLPAMGIFYDLAYRNGRVASYVVPKGYAVVLGDNAPVSDDSRQFGPVLLTNIVGRVLWAPPPPAGSRP